MNKKNDLESLLKQYECSPRPQVNRSLLSHYTQTYGLRKTTVLWKRPVPLYKAVVAVVFAVLLSFFAGKTMFVKGEFHEEVSEPIKGKFATSKQNIKPVIALNELL